MEAERAALQTADDTTSFHIRAHFSESIDSLDVRTDNVTIGGNAILAAFQENPEKKPGQVTYVVATPFAANQNYTLEVVTGGVHDLAHNPIGDTVRKVTVTAPAEVRSATAPMFAAIGIRDSALGVATIPSIPVRFSDAVRRDSVEQSIVLRDSSQKIVRASFNWIDDSRMMISTNDSLLSAWFAHRGGQ